MSFLDKLFSYKNRNYKNENVLKTETEDLSFRSSHLSIPKEQIRFILFRECDRRGRKLLFDSNAVEKIPLLSKSTMCNQKCQQNSERIIDFIETTSTHGYKYKKPSSDVACLGEMIFGSVAMTYKGENSCKIHSIPSPKQLMFTTIVHAPSRCPTSTASDISLGKNSTGSSFGSLGDILNQQQTSSSDSKLYRKEGVGQKYSSTYPWIRHNAPLSKINQCCQISDLDSNLEKKSSLHRDSGIECLGCLCLGNQSNTCNILQDRKKSSDKHFLDRDFSAFSGNYLNFLQSNSDCERDSSSNFGSSVVTSLESENFSSVSNSLSSLRRRWAQSYATSLESIAFEEAYSSPSKKRTKLGLALVLDLSNTLENEIEKFLFNHTIVIDSIINKLQSSVEMAYLKNENFVDLIYTAFQESQQSIYELITGGKYDTPLWCTLIGEPDNSLETSITGKSGIEDNLRMGRRQDLHNSIQLKFLDSFCDILDKFDTKDTNFFISTLLTAVLTHHLSWVNTIAETDFSTPKDLSVIKSIRSYNPLWAQLNDLCGLLGSPLRSAKTIITGAESQKSNMASIIQALTYFIRCYNIVENIYEVDIDQVVGKADLDIIKFMENFDSDIESDGHSSSVTETKKVENKLFSFRPTSSSETEKSSDDECQRQLGPEISLLADSFRNSNATGGSLKRNKSSMSLKKQEKTSEKLYPDIKDLAKSENVNVNDLYSAECEQTVSPKKLFDGTSLMEKIQKMIRVTGRSVNAQLEGYLSPDEGYDTIDSTKADNVCVRKVEMEKQFSALPDKKENIVFVLGDNEELVNLQKKIVVTKSSVINLEKEEGNESQSDPEHITMVDSETFSAPVNSESSEEGSRTLKDASDRIWSSREPEKIEHSPKKVEKERYASFRIPWLVRELKMPEAPKICWSKRLEVSSVLGGVNQQYNSEQVIQGVIDPVNKWEPGLQKDLFLSAHNPTLEKNVNEALCIIGDMNSWEVTIISSNSPTLTRKKQEGIRVGMSQLVADMLESFLHLHKVNLSADFCLLHIEKKLYEIYLKSKTVAELLNSTELCNIDYLTTRLDIGINDVPLLLSVASTHSPHISEKYGLSFT